MYSKLFTEDHRPKFSVSLSNSYTRLAPFELDDNGVVVRKSEFVECNSNDLLSKFDSSDFAIANILAVGAYDKLKPVYLAKNSDMSVVDSFEDSYNGFIASQNVQSSEK